MVLKGEESEKPAVNGNHAQDSYLELPVLLAFLVSSPTANMSVPSDARCSKTKIASFIVSVFISAGYMHHTTTELSHSIHSGMTIDV